MDATRFHQVVPRPSSVARGDPWHWLVEGGAELSLKLLLDAVAVHLGPATDPHDVDAAVLVGFFERAGEPMVLLTRRAATLRSEPLTVSFPGGRLDAGETPLDAALREAEEEVGVARAEVSVVGALPVVVRGLDFGRILPVVAHIDGSFSPRPNPEEVDAVLEVPLRALLEEGASWTEWWGSGESRRRICFFTYEGTSGADLIWGLTAGILWRLLEFATETLAP